jgi:methionine synthase II (cobalamin-independent)
LGRLFAEEVRELKGKGFATFEWVEPLLVYQPPTPTLAESVIAAYEAIGAAAQDSLSLLWTYFGDAAPILPLLARLPVSSVGFDLSETDPASITDRLGGRGLGLGVVDPRTTLSEDPGHIATIVRDLQGRLHPPSIWLGPGAPLDLLAAEPAARKLHVLAAARDALSTTRRVE